MYKNKKKNIFLIGPMGSGKSTIGLHLSKFLNMIFYDSDVEIKKKKGMDINQIFKIYGECRFRIIEEKIINELTNKTGIILATGGGSIVSLKSRNCLVTRGFVIYLKVNINEQLTRMHADKTRPLLSNDRKKNKQILINISKERDLMYQNISHVIIDTNNKKIQLIISNILDILNTTN